jgi:hypothetical protein
MRVITTFTPGPMFAAYLAYPDKVELRAIKEAEKAAKPSHDSPAGPRDRNRLTDFTIRTCGYCFRDIKATDPGGVIVDHGFTIQNGYREGKCPGTGMLPFERSPAATRVALAHTLRRYDDLVHDLDVFRNRPPKTLTVREFAYAYSVAIVTPPPALARRHVEVQVTVPQGDHRYQRRLQDLIAETERELAFLDKPKYGGWRALAWILARWQPIDHAEPPGTVAAVGWPRVDEAEAGALTRDAAEALQSPSG